MLGMQGNDVLVEAIERIRGLVEDLVGTDAGVLDRQPAHGANSMAWLLWHTTRVQDAHVAELMDEEQLWEHGDFAERLGRPNDPRDTGYGHSVDAAAAVRVDDPSALLDYHSAVADRTVAFLDGLQPDDLDRVVDESYDPPVTAGARMVSVVQDSLEHLGQAAYVRGLLGGG
jgi:hypothetical protein